MKIRPRLLPSGKICFQLDLGMVQGKRKLISFRTKELANAALVEKKGLLKAHGEDALAFTEINRKRYAAAETQLDLHGATLEEAVAFFITHNKARTNIRFAELVERCYESKLALKKDREYARGLRLLGRAFCRAGYGEHFAHEIGQPDVERWLNGNVWSPKTQHIYLTDLGTIFAHGIAQKHLTLNPCKGVMRPQLENKPPEIFNVETCRRMMTTAFNTEGPEAFRGKSLNLLAFLGICLFAGVRPEEVQRLQWSEVHLDESFIEVRAEIAKSRRRRIVTISENLAAWLKLAVNTTGKVMPPGIQKRMRKLRELADLPDWPQDVLRHSFASYHLAAHHSAEKTSLEMGHKDTDILFRHYRELVRPAEAKAFWEIRPPLTSAGRAR